MSESSSIELHPLDDGQRTYVLITGANSGLGFATCRRIIDVFLATRPNYQSLTLIVTTRSVKRSQETIDGLKYHIQRKSKGEETPIATRITLQPESLDLSSIRSVHELAAKLCKSVPHLDAVILNAGIGGITGVNWPMAFWRIFTQPVQAVTYPDYKITSTGDITTTQKSSKSAERESSEDSTRQPPPLGLVFTSNILGHYILSHLLTPILVNSTDHGRIIFTSSLEAYPTSFSLDDLQGLQTDKSYESSKRLTDLLVLTSALPSTSPFTSRFLTPPKDSSTTPSPPFSSQIRLHDNVSADGIQNSTTIALDDHTIPSTQKKPTLYLSHPGICATSFLPLPLPLYWAMTLVFFFCRLLGSPWHTTSAYRGAHASVWLALTNKEDIDDIEIEGGKGKWGSGCDWLGREQLYRTAVAGWGGGGRAGDTGGVEEEMALGRARGRGKVERVTKEAREEFEALGREVWKQMEELRGAWESFVRG